MSAEQSLYVDRDYVANLDFEDIVFGRDLRDGMIVLLEDALFRVDLDRLDNKYERARADEHNRWCEVTRLEFVATGRSPLVQFVGVYPDRTARVRTFAASYAWIVKKVQS